MKKLVKTFTLSSYDDGMQIVDGKLPKNPSFQETLGPLSGMIHQFDKHPTGTKIKVTFEVIKTTNRRK